MAWKEKIFEEKEKDFEEKIYKDRLK